MNAAKVQLSKEELALVSDPGWILTKNSIMERAVGLLAALSEDISGELRVLRGELEVFNGEGELLPLNWATPKISKGENYLGLPYVVLDYPRLFRREDVLAIRTMFWWGHYFSVTLHLKGRYKDLFLPVIKSCLPQLMEANFHIAVSGDEWRHEVEVDNYTLLQAEGMHMAEGSPFLKLSAKCLLDKWNEAPAILLGLNKLLIRVLIARR
ncbi:MAG: hypothetical protein J0H74_22070 [Chitinophagaceae bacterium]|nr:hypothetical protein [Chitinophagaceae bacterium]